MRKVLSIFLGLFLLAMGVNKFLGFMPLPPLEEPGAQFMAALMSTGYMIPMIGITEILCGLLLMVGATAPLGALLLAPLSVNIVAFHLFLAPSAIAGALFVFVLNVALGILFFENYRAIFAKIFAEKVIITQKEKLAAPPVVTVNG